jgi:ABC-type lipoprotein release transport system permease subunit
MNTRLVRGRGIDPSDRPGQPAVAVVSQRLARELFGERDPLGASVIVDGQARDVVGVAEDAPSNDLHELPQPFVYLPFLQVPSGDLTLVVEAATADPASLARAVREALRAFDPAVVVYSTTTLRAHMERALARDRTFAWLTLLLGAIAVLLTAAGTFAVVQHGVARRTREFALRLALGAERGQVQRMVVREAVVVAAWGVPLGVGLLAGAAAAARSLVLGIDTGRLIVFASGAAAALIVAVVASWLPAWQAGRVDPLVALRDA